MRIAVEVLVPLRLFVVVFVATQDKPASGIGCRSPPQSEFLKKFRLEVLHYGLQQSQRRKKWRLWKEAEEKQLRSLGVNEDDIEKLRVHDWAIFNSDRRYYQRVQETGTYLDELVEDTIQPEVKTVEGFSGQYRKSAPLSSFD